MDEIFNNVYLWAQILGFVGVAMNVAIWQIKDPEKIISAYIPTNILWAFQYYLIGGTIGVIASILYVFRDSCFIILNKKNHKNVIFVLIFCVCIIGMANLKTIFDILPLAGMLLFNIGFFFKDRRELLARFSLLNSLLWVIFCLSLGSFFNVLSPALTLVSVIIGMSRHEKWEIGKCYRSFLPSVGRALFIKPQTYP